MNIVVPFRSTVYYKMNVICTRIFLKISARKKPVTDFPDSENKSIALKILNKRLYRLKRTNADAISMIGFAFIPVIEVLQIC